MPDNPHRPTATWKLWALGLAGGLLVSVGIFWQGLDNGPAARAVSERLHRQTYALLVLGAIGAGGLVSIFRGRR